MVQKSAEAILDKESTIHGGVVAGGEKPPATRLWLYFINFFLFFDYAGFVNQ